MPSREPRRGALVLTPPGVGPILKREATRRGLVVVAVENDGRSDVVRVRGALADVSTLRCRDDVLLDLGTLDIRRTATETARQLPTKVVAKALARAARHGNSTSEVRAVVRLRSEPFFTRTQLRAAIERRLSSRPALPAGEVWVIQTTARTLRVGVRVRALTRRGERRHEREGSLPASIAAAMVEVAGRPRGLLLDPCCGSGSVAVEAESVGWEAIAGDVADEAISTATRNGVATAARLDARRLPFPGGSFAVVVSNLPFGHQHEVRGLPVAWYRRVLSEAMRVAPAAVLLATPSVAFRQALGRLDVSLVERRGVTVLGRHAAIWSIARRHRR